MLLLLLLLLFWGGSGTFGLVGGSRSLGVGLRRMILALLPTALSASCFAIM